jgi:hypothetical protein
MKEEDKSKKSECGKNDVGKENKIIVRKRYIYFFSTLSMLKSYKRIGNQVMIIS